MDVVLWSRWDKSNGVATIMMSTVNLQLMEQVDKINRHIHTNTHPYTTNFFLPGSPCNPGLQRLSGMVFRDIQQTAVCEALWDHPLCHPGQCESPTKTDNALPLLQDPGLEECLRGHSCVEVYRQSARICLLYTSPSPRD